jgi:hypothetical protein
MVLQSSSAQSVGLMLPVSEGEGGDEPAGAAVAAPAVTPQARRRDAMKKQSLEIIAAELRRFLLGRQSASPDKGAQEGGIYWMSASCATQCMLVCARPQRAIAATRRAEVATSRCEFAAFLARNVRSG